MKRRWERAGIETSAVGLGCWAIAGKWNDPGASWEWHGTQDEESMRAIRAAIDHGVTLLDTADVYGSGHSEVVVGKALQGSPGLRDQVVLATKFGHCFDEAQHRNLGYTDASPAYVRRAVEGSLRRLGTDRIDLYQLHVWEHPVERADEVVEVLEELVRQGKVRTYGWSTDVKAGVEAFARGPHCGAAQIQANVFESNDRLIAYGEGKGLALLCRSPLAMGLLSGRYAAGKPLPSGDVRTSNAEWISWFKDGKANPNYARRLEAAREILQSDGRTLVQGALAWLWAKSPNLVPIPGFKSEQQAVENARAMEKGPLTAAQLKQVAELVAYEDRAL